MTSRRVELTLYLSLAGCVGSAIAGYRWALLGLAASGSQDGAPSRVRVRTHTGGNVTERTEDTAPESMVLLVETVDVLLKTVARLNDTVRILHGRIERELASRVQAGSEAPATPKRGTVSSDAY